MIAKPARHGACRELASVVGANVPGFAIKTHQPREDQDHILAGDRARAAGNRTSIATQFGTEAAKTVTFEYGAANRLTRTTSAEGEVTTFTYDANYRLLSATGMKQTRS
jgi:YD repeat-containing protein